MGQSSKRVGAVLRPLLMAAALLVSTTAAAERVLVEGVAALVDRKVITRTQVRAEGRMILVNRVGERGASSAIDEPFLKSVLEFLVVQELLVGEARRRGITARENDVDRGLAAFMARFETEQAYLAFLVETGVDVEDVRDVIRRDVGVAALLDAALDDGAEPSDAMVAVYVRQRPDLSTTVDAARVRALAVEAFKAMPRDARFALLVESIRQSAEVRIVAEYGP